MENEQQNTEQPVDASTETKNTDQPQGHMIPKSRLDDVIAERENLKARLSELETATQERQRKELEAREEYKALYEQAQQQLTGLESVQSELDRYRTELQAMNTRRLEGLSEGLRGIVPDYDDPVKLASWLDKAAPVLAEPGKPTPPPTDGGAGVPARRDETPLPDSVSVLLQAARNTTGFDLNQDNIRKRMKGNN